MRALTLGRLALALALAFPLAGRAQLEDRTLLLDLCVNDACAGIAAVVVRGQQVLVDRAALAAAGIALGDVVVERIGDRDFVDVALTGRFGEVALDEQALRLDLRQRAADRALQRVDMRPATTLDPATQPWSAFLNYAAALGDETADRSLYLDGAVGRGHAALRSTAQWSHDTGLRRGLTRFELDRPASLQRWTAGDQYAIAGDALGGGALLGGIGVERAFEQDPYRITFPQPNVSGVIERPGVVEVYANGALVARRELEAGPFTLAGLGIPPGRNDVQVVVRDPFGNRSVLSTGSYYASSTLLAAGLDEYAARVGLARDGGGLDPGYGSEVLAQAWYRRGLSDWITAGARVEGGDGLRNLGGDVVLRMPVGEFAFAAARSDHDRAGAGHAHSASWNLGTRDFGASLGTRRASRTYRRLGDGDAVTAAILHEDYASLAWSPAGPFSLRMNVGRQLRDGAPPLRSAGATAGLRVGSTGFLQLGVQRFERAGLREHEALLSYRHAFGRDSAGASLRRDDAGTTLGLDLRRARPAGIGWGHDLSVQRIDGRASGFGQLEYQGAHGRYALQAERFGGQARGRLLASGALVGIGGRVHATAPLESGFALVRVPGVAGLAILRENMPIGSTDARGDLLVRGMLPFHANKLSFDPAALPIAYRVGASSQRIAVGRNTGAMARFDVAPLRAVTGTLLRDGVAISGGVLIVEGAGAVLESPVGRDGRFWLQDLPGGVQRARVEQGGTVVAHCVIGALPAAEAGIHDAGELACTGPGLPVDGNPADAP